MTAIAETSPRKIIEIDIEKCTGCGQCVLNCPEGALEVVDGKARVVNEHFCDGLGACIGECPENALQIVEREAPPFDEAAVLEQETQRRESLWDGPHLQASESKATGAPELCQCPSARMQVWDTTQESERPIARNMSALHQWPLKLRLLPPSASIFKEAKTLVILSDCASLADPNLHADFLEGATVVQVCPKFEEPRENVTKLAAIFQNASQLERVHVVEMVVPCCRHLLPEVLQAIKTSGIEVSVEESVVDPHGEIAEFQQVSP